MKTNFNQIVCTLFFAVIITISANAQHGKYVGGDISMLPQYEKHNSPYLDKNNKPIDDLITWLVDECGWNTFRVRLFVDPYSPTDPCVCQDLEYVKQLGKRIKDAGAYFMLDYHYSDTWVDATHIQAPRAWKECSVDQKVDSIIAYTRTTLQELIAYGAAPDMVQVGNEIMYGFMGISVHPYEDLNDDWDSFLRILKAGCQTVREILPHAEIIIHTDRLSNQKYNQFYYGKLMENGVDFDVIGLSYYPFWHGFLKELKTGLDGIKRDFPEKKVQIVETGYYFQYWPSTGINYNTSTVWPATALGQYNCMKDLITFLRDYEQVEGLCYWNPEDAGNGDDTNWNTTPNGTVSAYWTNRGLWNPAASKSGHTPISCSEGMVHYIFREFLANQGTNLDNLQSEVSQPHKQFINNTLQLIMPNGTIYDVSGRLVK